MKLLLLSTAYNGLTQRAHLELQAAGHEIYLELAIHDRQMMEAVKVINPELIICPFLKAKIPEAIWRKTRTIIIHPGIVGDRGPSSLEMNLVNALIDARGTGFMAELASYLYDVCEPTNLPRLLEFKQKNMPSKASLE
jgi:putative two-component system hydrogenase maturation factor HypX/HoxX